MTLRVPLRTSQFLDPLPELTDVDASAVVLSPSDHTSWAEMFNSHPDALDYLLTPGDYRSWGRLQRQDLSVPSGSAARRRTFRYHDPNDEHVSHPVRRAGRREAIIDDSDIWRGGYLIFSGLTFRPVTLSQTTMALRPEVTHVVIDQCLFEDYQTSGVIIYGSHNTLQRTVLRNARIAPGRDTNGVMTTLQAGVENVGSRVLDCEVYNHVDEIAATVSSAPGTALRELRDCIIDGNDFYNDSTYIETADSMENLLDYKVGSDTASTNFVTNNRFWGLATSGGGSGGSNHSLLFHRAARGWVIADNIIGQNSSDDAAIFESVWHPQDVPSEDLYRERRNRYLRNLIYGHSRALGVSLDGHAESNSVLGTDYLLFRAPDAGRLCPTEATVIDTRMGPLLSVEDRATVATLESFEMAANMAAPPAVVQYQRRRWTGPEWFTFMT